MVVELSDMEFNQRVGDGISFVKVWSPTCQPCKMYKNIFEDFASKNEDIQCYAVNAFECPAVVTQFSLKRVPVTLIIKNGELMSKKEGVLQVDELEANIPE